MLRLTLALSLSCAACARSAPAVQEPASSASAKRFLSALESDDSAGAYALLAPELQASVSRADFEGQWRDNREEMLALVRYIAETDVAASTHARVDLEGGEQVVLVFEDGGWKLQGGVLDAQALSTPLDAVAELRRALRRQSLPALLRLLSRERRAAWQAAFEESIENTEDLLDLEVEVRGDEATVRTSSGGSIELRREAGRWRIWDVR